MQLNKWQQAINSNDALSKHSSCFSQKAFLLDKQFYWIIENSNGSKSAVMNFIDEKKGTFFEFTVHALVGRRL